MKYYLRLNLQLTWQNGNKYYHVYTRVWSHVTWVNKKSQVPLMLYVFKHIKYQFFTHYPYFLRISWKLIFLVVLRHHFLVQENFKIMFSYKKVKQKRFYLSTVRVPYIPCIQTDEWWRKRSPKWVKFLSDCVQR